MRLVYRKKMLENRHFLIGIFQHFTTVADILASPFLVVRCFLMDKSAILKIKLYQ